MIGYNQIKANRIGYIDKGRGSSERREKDIAENIYLVPSNKRGFA